MNWITPGDLKIAPNWVMPAEHDPTIAERRSRDSFAADPVLKTENGRVVSHQRRDRNRSAAALSGTFVVRTINASGPR